MKRLNWREPVETIDGVPVRVSKVLHDRALVRGLVANPEVGRKGGPNIDWHYPLSGKAPLSFLPELRNVGD